MADFKTHIAASTVLGVGYAGVAAVYFGVPWQTCVLAGGLCSVSGMLPDLDSGPGRPLRESLAFAAAVIPMLLLDRAQHLGWSNEWIALAGGAIYVTIRFVIGWLLRHYTVHRGMFHSIPAAIIATEIAFLLCTTGGFNMRCFKAGAVLAGFMSHLLLDEFYSIERRGVTVRVKSSFGTAVKLWGDSVWANLSAYAKLILLTVLVLRDPVWEDVPAGQSLHKIATSVSDTVEKEVTTSVVDRFFR